MKDTKWKRGYRRFEKTLRVSAVVTVIVAPFPLWFLYLGDWFVDGMTVPWYVPFLTAYCFIVWFIEGLFISAGMVIIMQKIHKWAYTYTKEE